MQTYGRIDPAVISVPLTKACEQLTESLKERGISFKVVDPNTEQPGLFGPDSQGYTCAVDVYCWAQKGKQVGEL